MHERSRTTKIANELEKRKVENPVAYGKRNGIVLPAKQAYDDPYIWRNSTIARMLSRQEYLGHTVNFKTRRKSYKQKKKIKNDPSEWQIFENTHEAIIDEETFNIVQKIHDGRRRFTPMGEMPILSGMVFCTDCGNKLYQVRGRGWEHDKEYFVCATYRKKKGGCRSHQIRNVVVEQFLLQYLQQVTTFAREHEGEFISLVTDTSEQDLERKLKDSSKEYEQAKARITALDNIIQKLYEDNVIGKISDERFMKLTVTYETEQAQLQSRITELQQFLDSTREKSLNAEHFLSLVRKYTGIKELDAEIIRQFIEKIIVYKAEKADGHRQQHIEVIFNCIGEVELPKPQEKTA